MVFLSEAEYTVSVYMCMFAYWCRLSHVSCIRYSCSEIRMKVCEALTVLKPLHLLGITFVLFNKIVFS